MPQKGIWLRRVLGGEIEASIRPLLVTLTLGVTASYMFWSMFALWAIDELEMSKGSVGLAYLAAALLGMVGGLVGGSVSDHVGRKPVILVAAAAQLALTGLLVVPPLPTTAAVVVLALFGFVQPIRGAAHTALLADLVPDERRTVAFGSFRIALNTGALGGPLLAAGLVTISWNAVHLGIVTVYALSTLAAFRLPNPPLPARAEGRSSSLSLFRSQVFVTLLVAGALASTTYNAFETLFPISLTQEHGYQPAAWGVLFGINPVLVLLLQLRITRWSAPIAPAHRLALGLVLMGTSFLLVLTGASAVILAVIVVVFVVGEMLWAPNADALTARAAPVESRGALLGTLGMSTWIGGAIAPAVGLRVADVAGDAAMWGVVAAISIGGAMTFAVADRLVRSPEASGCEPSPEAA